MLNLISNPSKWQIFHTKQVSCSKSISSSRMRIRVRGLVWNTQNGNMDKARNILKAITAQYNANWIRIIISIGTIIKSQLSKTDFICALSWTDDAKFDIYITLSVNVKKSFCQLLIASVYGLVNTNSAWQEHSDFPFSSLGSSQSRYMPHFFLFLEGKKTLRLPLQNLLMISHYWWFAETQKFRLVAEKK